MEVEDEATASQPKDIKRVANDTGSKISSDFNFVVKFSLLFFSSQNLLITSYSEPCCRCQRAGGELC